MQFMWKYIDDMIGKGLESTLIIKFLGYTAATLVPSALPLAILLSSIMTMGNFGENSEITAAKASGISIMRFFKSLIIFSIVMSIGAFIFSNVVLGKATVVAKSMLEDIRNLKPALFIKPKTFYNGLGGVSLRIDDKNEETGKLYGLQIYNHAAGKSNESILLARSGEMVQSEDGKILILRLDSCTQYMEAATNSYDNLKFPHYTATFDRYEKRFDLSQFKLGEQFGKSISQVKFILNLSQLRTQIDSFKKEQDGEKLKFDTTIQSLAVFAAVKDKQRIQSIFDSIRRLDTLEMRHYRVMVTNKARNIKNIIYFYKSEEEFKENTIAEYEIEWNRKFTLSIACIVLFFVGAPLGAIIRKGGLGWPMLFSVIFFILYWFLGIFGDKVSSNRIVSPYIGMWISTLVFLPFGLFLTLKATNDSALFSFDQIKVLIKDRWVKLFKNNGTK
jgi:lipopolysaccharide export system permease protein